ncbi:LysR family transcriptional regulator [Neorhizobium galegae]|uniref:LysR family transcriptional regulator n=1 Tax=Neorhizobium galegae TaxID=399 RepID=UPI000621D18D|nr:LysR family transcriptional regulator [Neorhizobium galegae]CDZ26621.1 Transcriptional regulator, LysR family [Neorhizobium galegae bv. officinalis]KAA9383590.1 LysR family transcriptional regulator [Neorhizobium galegae]KAB1111721.1 LysR family transcriptional regulator [Neorhizobium galegae]MCM2500792.1 LysR family transcriptional regulator [Neorhizobium galegae]MCQ1769806.1 LysR family transcriptional regulator [Neorhizobium galegae]
MRYTLRQIEYFIATAETGSITLASERLNISQPSISTAITHLEEELETQLFVRHHAKGLSLTPAGRVLLVEAKRLVDQAEHMYTVASEVNDKVRGQLSLGCMVTLASMIMPELSHSFTAAFPATRIAQTVSDHETLLDKLQRAELDVVISYDLLIPTGFEFLPLASLPPHVLVGENHPFARFSSISMEELAGAPLILLDLPISREYFLGLFAKHGLEPTIATRSTHQDVIRTMVANGYGYTLANVRPKSQVAMDGRPVVRVPITGDHKPVVIGVFSLKSGRKARLLEIFEQHCKSFVSDAYIPGMVAPLMERRRSPT